MEISFEKKLQSIESELRSLKSLVITLSQSHEPKKIVKIKGLLEGVEVDEDEIKEAKNSFFIRK